MNEENSQDHFECFCGEDFKEHEKHYVQRACKELPFYKENNGNLYCVLHYPDKNKREDFDKVFREKIENNDFNFDGAYFPIFFIFPSKLKEVKFNVNFSRATFSSGSQFRDVIFHEEVSFTNAEFSSGIRLEKVIFKKKVDFSSSYSKDGFSFKNVEAWDRIDFTGAHIDSRAFIENCQFKGRTTFHFARFFRDSHFSNSEFLEIDFNSARFKDDALFLGTIFHKSQFANTTFEKYASFRKAVFKNNADFQNCCFFHVGDFTDADFEKDVDFTKAIFGNPDLQSDYPKGGYFEGTYFQGFAIFEETIFEISDFKWSAFEKEAVFRITKFNKDADFTDAFFKATANFKDASFQQKATFQGTIFETHLKFIGSNNNSVFQENNVLDLKEVRITSTEQVVFHSVLLRPSWFLNIDCRKFTFTKINWKNADGSQESVKIELDNVKDVEDACHLFVNTCRQLAQNSEENNFLQKASDFRKMAFEAERLERKEIQKTWRNKFIEESNYGIDCFKIFSDGRIAAKKCWNLINDFPYDILHFFYGIFSGYGERWFRAFVILFVILAISTFLYTTSYSEFKDGTKGLECWAAMSYSLRVMALQRPEPQPHSNIAQMVVALQTIFAPLQLALLALAIRRKFMR